MDTYVIVVKSGISVSIGSTLVASSKSDERLLALSINFAHMSIDSPFPSSSASVPFKSV